jgi:hypothetical protein
MVRSHKIGGVAMLHVAACRGGRVLVPADMTSLGETRARSWERAGGRSLALAALFVLGSWAQPAAADDWECSHHFAGGYFMIGWSALELDDLNTALAAHGYPEFDESMLSLGGGGHVSFGRLVLGGQGHGYLSESRDAYLTTGTYRTTLTAGIGFFDIGYQLLQGGRTRLACLVGLGGGGVHLKMVDLSGPTFEDVLTDPGRSAELSTSGFLLDLGFSVDLLTRHINHRDTYGGPLVGLRAGYILAPVKGDWRLGDREIAGGPRIGVEGAYVRALLGFGGGR